MDATDTIPLSRDWLGLGKDYFFLRLKGDAMADALQPGDLVLVERLPQHPLISQAAHLNSGELVVAIIEEEAICRRYFTHPSGILLRADNPRYEAITVAKDFQLLGKVKALVRKYQ